jgi:hypothetical protein
MAVQSGGVNWGTSGGRPGPFSPGEQRWGLPRRRPRVSDEAIVSNDLGGQHNLLASQGPLDERVGVGSGHARLEKS